MKQLALAIFLYVAFSGGNHATERKIAYEHRDNIFVADADGTHQKKVATGALPEFHRTEDASHSTLKPTPRHDQAPNVTSRLSTSPPAKSRF
jgi:hypothetical protein